MQETTPDPSEQLSQPRERSGPNDALTADALTAAPPRAVSAAAPSYPPDTLPLAVLAGIVLCFALHFATRLLRQTQVNASLPARTVGRLAGGFDLEICNETGKGRVYVAVAYFDPLRNDWVARGWFPQRQGECQTAMRQLAPPVYVLAETQDGAARWKPSGEEMEFCIDGDKAFVVSQSRCERGTRQRFAELSLSEAATGKVFKWELKDAP